MSDAKKRPCRRCVGGTEVAVFNDFWTCKKCFDSEQGNDKKEEEITNPFISFDEDEPTSPGTGTGWQFQLDLGD